MITEEGYGWLPDRRVRSSAGNGLRMDRWRFIPVDDAVGPLDQADPKKTAGIAEFCAPHCVTSAFRDPTGTAAGRPQAKDGNVFWP